MSRLREIVADALQSNILGSSAFAGEVRAEVAERVEAAIVAASGGPDHIVTISGWVYTLQHPIAERFEGVLANCPMTGAVAAEMEDEPEGQYRAWMEDGELKWEVVA